MLAAAGLVALLVAVVVAVQVREPDAPRRTALPEGMTTFADQSRIQRQTRTAYVRLLRPSDRAMTVTAATFASSRFGTVRWRGRETFTRETDLTFDVPRGRCGKGGDVRVTLTYTLGDEGPRTSRTTARDRYGAVAAMLDRDCARRVLSQAARLSLGDLRVEGRGRDARLVLPVTFTPTGRRSDVSFAGFESTVLFDVTGGSPTPEQRPRRLDTRTPLRVDLRLAPARCDPHALAEDKVGTLIGVRVVAPDVADRTSFYLPIGAERRARLHAFYAAACGL